MEKYASMLGRFFDVRIKGSTARVACLVMIGTGAFAIWNGDYANGVFQWAVGSAIWGIRDKLPE